tara:strand:- start:722 stop:871 length:150 start_codon:yes stop_codon:yes gene_type:complete
MEVAIPPNPYRLQIVILLTILICIKYDIPDKIRATIEKLIVRWLNNNWK